MAESWPAEAAAVVCPDAVFRAFPPAAEHAVDRTSAAATAVRERDQRAVLEVAADVSIGDYLRYQLDQQ
ncbi:hypothetical protein Aple_054820 [Acrocarpospora pleiomorpha]|uniref:Uncharacterized protein n=1 Tax=Acrocarpospora pleiomorpha TaxID=90975 RepID=A0A5M3XMX1_9ACTN|nr:hypothetical protein Aple_054820 [Acrocarpospora pleiomorpha]